MDQRSRIIATLVLAVLLVPLAQRLAPAGGGGIAEGAAAVVLALTIHFIWAGSLLARVFGRVLMALIPLVALAALTVYWIARHVPDNLAFKAALITGTVIATGWVATWVATEYQRDRERARTRREVLYALRSEIFTAFQTLDSIDWLENAQHVQDAIADGGDDENTRYHPFVGTESPPIVFQTVSASINLLPEPTLEPVLRFYSALNDLATLGADMRSDRFVELDAERRIGGHARLTDTRIATLKWAIQSLIAIDTALGIEHPERIERDRNNAQLVITQRDGRYVVEVTE